MLKANVGGEGGPLGWVGLEVGFWARRLTYEGEEMNRGGDETLHEGDGVLYW